MAAGKETSIGVRLVADLRNYQSNLKKAQTDSGKFKNNVKREMSGVSQSISQLARGDITALPTFFKSATTAAGGFSKGLQGVKAALIATGIGALIVGLGVAIGAVTQYFKGTEEGQIVFKKVMNNVKAYIEPVLSMFGKFGKAIVQLFKGDFEGAWETAKSAVEEVGGAIQENTKNVGELNAAEERYIKLKRENLLKNKKLEAEINEARRIANDEDNYSAAQRSKAINEAIAKQKQLAENKKQELDLETRIAEIKASFGDNDIATNDKLAELKAQQFDIISEQERAIKRMGEDQQRINRELGNEIKLREEAAELANARIIERKQISTFTTIENKKINSDDFKPEVDTTSLADMSGFIESNNEKLAELTASWWDLFDVTNLVADTVPNITNAFGQMIAGTKGAFHSLVSSVLGGIQKIINGLLAEAIAGMIAGEAKKGLLGLVTASVGLAALTSVWQSKIPKFADGGIAFGPTLGLMGEYSGARNNPEVIAPLSKLKDMLPGSEGNGISYVPADVIIGDDHIRISYERGLRRLRNRT